MMSFRKLAPLFRGAATLLIALAGLGAVTAVLIGSRTSVLARLVRNESSQPSAVATGVGGVQQIIVNPPTSLEVVRFSVYSAGLLPRQSVAKAGRIAVIFEDFSENSSGLIIKPNSGPAMPPGFPAMIPKAQGMVRTRVELALPAGVYQVLDQSRPSHSVLLTVH